MNQKTNFKSGFLRFFAFALITLLLVAAFAVIGSAEPPEELTVDASKLIFAQETGIVVTPEGVITKTYDGSADIDKTNVSVDPSVFPENVTIAVDTISWAAKDAGLTSVNVTFTLSGAAADDYAIKAASYSGRIVPVSLKWVGGSTATATATYAFGATSYSFDAADLSNLPEIDKTELSPALAAEVEAMTATITSVTPVNTVSVGNYATEAAVTLSNSNFTIATMPVSVTINPVEITNLVWSNTDDLTYGSPKNIRVTAYDAANRAYEVYVIYCPNDFGNAGTFVLTAVLNNPNFSEAAELVTTKEVTIKQKVCEVSMKNLSVAGDGRTAYTIGVEGTDLPTEVKANIVYAVNGRVFYGASAAGTYTITAFLPVNGNYAFTSGGNPVTELSATLTVTMDQMPVPVKSSDGKTAFDIILTAKDGLPESVSAVAVEATDVKLPEGTKYAQSFQIQLLGTVGDESYTVIVPLSYELYSKGCKELSAASLYVYDQDGNPVVASQNGFTVTAADGYFKIDGIKGSLGTITFTIAPEYDSGEVVTPLQILIIVLILVVLLLIVMFFIGRAVRKSIAAKNAEKQVETETLEEVPVLEPETEPEIELEPESFENPFEEEAETFQGPEGAVPRFARVAVEVDDNYIEDPFEGLEANSEPAAFMDDMPVEEPVAEQPTVEPSVEAFAAVAAEQNTRLVYIDTKKNPERYREMLDAEAAGEAKILYRYRKSYQALLSQSDDKIQDYYSAIKNALLHYRSVHARKSWSYEAFNSGRTPIARIIPKNKTLCLYLNIAPAELEGTKYNVSDVSDKKKFEGTPSLLKIRGDRKFKFALELIEKICGETLALKPSNKPEADYKIPYMETEDLIDAGLIKKLAALAPLDATETYGQKSDED